MTNSPICPNNIRILSGLFSYPDSLPNKDDLKKISVSPDTFSEDDLNSIQAEYIKLFVNALPEVPCPPYGSFYIEGSLMGKTTLEIKKLYEKYGFASPEMADHIAVELEFLSILMILPTELRDNEDLSFLLDHIKGWSGIFLDGIEQNDKTGFYTAVSKFASEILY